jgi:hypothetical protein
MSDKREKSGAEGKAASRRRKILLAAFAAVVFLHLLLFVQAERNAPIFSGQPLTWIDFDTHAEQVYRVTDALAGWGKPWAYDVQLLAGYPTGTVFDADNKGWELWTYGLMKVGVPRPIAFNLFVLLIHLLVPGTVYWAARLFRLERWEALLAAALAIGLWFFDGLARWSWFSGGVSYALVTFLFLLPIGLFYAHLRTGKAWYLAPLAVVMSLGHLVHPSIFVVLVVPMTAMYVRSFKSLGWKRHLGIVAVALVVVVSNAWWLTTAFRYAHYVTDHEPFFVGAIHHVLLDMGEVIDELTRTGLVGNRTGFRFLALIAAVVTLVLWRRNRDDRFLPLVSGLGFLVTMAYAGGYLWVFRQIQPYRSIVPAAFLSTIPAAALAGEVWRRRALHGLPRLAWAPIGLAAFLGVSHLATDILYFFPKLMPEVPALPTGEEMHITAYGFPEHRDFRHHPPEQHFDDAAKWVLEHDDGQGRFLVEWWVLGEHLLWRTNAQILGGFRERNLEHRAANLFQRYPQGHVPDDELARYLEQYAVRWVIVSQELPIFESKGVLEKVATVGPHRMYRTRVPVSFVRGGGGRVEASLNRIQVMDTDANRDVVLRFHWFETLVCEPDCRVQREPLADNPVGFIKIPAPHPSSFSVINGY